MSTQKKILILSNTLDTKLYTNIQKYSENKIYRTSYKSLNFKIRKGSVEIYDRLNGMSLDEYDLVHFKQYRMETKAITLFLEYKKIPYLNKDISSNFIYYKLEQYVKLALEGFNIPDTLYSSNNGLKGMVKDLQYPIILKSINSSLGQNNFLIHTGEELVKTLDANKEMSFVIQTFIPNTFDYRVLILGGKLGTVLKRIRQNKADHRNNTALGAKEEEVSDPDPKLVNLSIEISALLNKDVAGVDLIFDEETQDYFIIEMNSKPSFTYDSEVSSEVPQFAKFIDGLISR